MTPSPATRAWTYGPVPDVEAVGYGTRLVLFADGGWVATLSPHGTASTALRWFGLEAPSLQPWDRPVGWWAVLRADDAPRPEHVPTWRECRQ